jgi:hypothetical protein
MVFTLVGYLENGEWRALLRASSELLVTELFHRLGDSFSHDKPLRIPHGS